MEDIFSGPGRSEDMDSLLFETSDNPDYTLRLCALQKLKVCGQYVVMFLSVKYAQIVPVLCNTGEKCVCHLTLLGINSHQGGSTLYSHGQ